MNHRRLKLFCLFLVTLAACGPRPDPRVGVRPLTADLVFGIPKIDEPVGLPGGVDFEQPIASLGGFERPGIQPGPQIQRIVCEEADSKQVRYAASNTFERKPPLGDFRWKGKGYSIVYLGDQPYPSPVPSFETRGIKNFTVIDAGKNPEDPPEYTYETEQIEFGSFARMTIEWHVIKNKYVPNPIDPNSPVIGAGNGVFIRKVSKVTPSGVETTFNPQPEVLFMPFREEGDETDVFGSEKAYVDPNTQETWQLEGQVTGTVGVDACGEMIDTRWVDGHLKVVSSEGTFETNYDYGIGTQYGAILLAEHREDCPKDFRYVRPIQGVPKDRNDPQWEDFPPPNEVCQRQAGSETIKKPAESNIDRNIGEIPPDY